MASLGDSMEAEPTNTSTTAAALDPSDPFAELRRHAGGNHPKARLNIVLAAVTEIVLEMRSSGGDAPPTPTEYFAGLMTALEGSVS